MSLYATVISNNTHSHNYYNYNYWEVTMYTDCRHGSRQQYRLTWVVPDKGQLNGCVCVCVFVDEVIFADDGSRRPVSAVSASDVIASSCAG